MSESELGRAQLELGADLTPLDADLKRAEARVAASVAAMQAMADKLEAHFNLKAGAIETAAARMANGAPGTATHTSNTVVDKASEVWGVRGPQHPGSLQNPLTVVLAAGKMYPMGSYGAGVGEDNASDAAGAQNDQAGFATTADIAALTSAVHALANNATPGQRMAAAGAAGLGEPNNAERVAVVLQDQDSQALRDMAAALARLEARQSGSGHSVFVDSRPGASRTIIAGPSGSGQTIISGPTGESTVRLDGGQYAGLISAIVGSGGGGGTSILMSGGGGNGRTVVPVLGGGDNGGGGLLRKILWGGGGTLLGLGGFAGMGSLASFAGLGPEHALVTLLGLAGSAAGAGVGAGLLGLGSLGKIGVGAGSDMAATLTTAQAVKGLNTAYENLDNAVLTYGKNSQQAQQAQQALNGQLAQLKSDYGPQAAKAINGVALALQGMSDNFNHAIAPAMVQATGIFQQGIGLANKFIPLIGQAATQNLALIDKDLKPLFAWLEGPQGVGIFKDLEHLFYKDLPFAMGAFDNGVELLLRVTDLAAQHTGGFTRELDKLLTRWNHLSNAQLSAEIDKFIHDFDIWKALVEALGRDIYYLFHQSAGTASSIVVQLTQMLDKLGQWEKSTRGSQQIRTIFAVHKQEIDAILSLLPALAKGFGSIYLEAAPPLTRALTDIVKLISSIANGLADLGPGSATMVGLALIAAKLGVLMPGVREILKLGGVTASTPVLGKILGGGSGGNIMGVRGPTAPGSAANPIAVTGMGGGAPMPRAPGEPVPLLPYEALGTGATITAAAAIAGSATVLAAVAYGLHKLDPSIFHFAPTTQPVDKVIANILPTPLSNPYNPLRNVHGNFGNTSLGAVGGPSSPTQIKQQTDDFLRMNSALAKLETHQAGIKQTANALDLLAFRANGLNDIKWALADKLGSELLKTRSVSSKGVQDILAEFKKLPPGAQAEAAGAMTRMADALHRSGVLPEGQVTKLMSALESTAASGFQNLVGQARAQMPQFADAFANSFANATSSGATGLHDLWVSVNNMLKLLGAPPLSALQVAVMNSPALQQAPTTLPHGAGTNLGAGVSGAPKHATGAKVNSPMYMVGEEHQTEYVLATNPAYRDRNVNLWLMAGHDLGIPGFAAGGIPAPKVKGHGIFEQIVSNELNKATTAANSYLARFGVGGAGGGGPVSSAGLSGSLIAIVDQISGKMGWNAADWLGVISLESGGSMTARNPSSGAYGIAQFINGPGEYAQYGGNVNTLAGQLTAMANYIAGRYGNPTNALAHEHAFRWYAKGGRIPGFKNGGIGIASAGSALLSGFGGLGGVPFTLPGALLGQAVFAKIMRYINGLMGTSGKVNKLTDLMSFWQGMWGLDQTVSGIMSGGPSAAVLTDASGNPYIDQSAVNLAIAHLGQEVGWESSLISDLTAALSYSQSMLHNLPMAIGGAKGYIHTNLTKIVALRKQLHGKHVTAARRKEINAQIAALEAQNAQIGGNKTNVGQGGLIGTWANYLSTLSGYPDQIGGAGGSGLGGELGPAKITLAQLSQELAALSPGALQAALATAQANGQSGGASQSALVSLLEQQNQTLAQQNEVLTAQYSVLRGPMYGLMGQGLPPFGGSFANGGRIPGFKGEPRTIIAHGGEVVSNGTPQVQVIVQDGAVNAERIRVIADGQIQKAGRQHALVARRQLPGRPGALLPS